MSDHHQFHRMLGAALEALDRASGAEDRAKAAQQRLTDAEAKLAEHAAAHAKLKQDSDRT
jgi:hypothetical protein